MEAPCRAVGACPQRRCRERASAVPLAHQGRGWCATENSKRWRLGHHLSEGLAAGRALGRWLGSREEVLCCRGASGGLCTGDWCTCGAVRNRKCCTGSHATLMPCQNPASMQRFNATRGSPCAGTRAAEVVAAAVAAVPGVYRSVSVQLQGRGGVVNGCSLPTRRHLEHRAARTHARHHAYAMRRVFHAACPARPARPACAHR